MNWNWNHSVHLSLFLSVGLTQLGLELESLCPSLSLSVCWSYTALSLNLGPEGFTGGTKKVPGYGVFFKVQTSCSQLTEMGHANYSTTSSVSKHNNLTLPLLLTRTQSFSQVISTSALRHKYTSTPNTKILNKACECFICPTL